MRHCPIFIWIHTPLKEYQGKYVYINDVQVILLALIDYIIFSVQTKWLGCCSNGSLVGKACRKNKPLPEMVTKGGVVVPIGLTWLIRTLAV